MFIIIAIVVWGILGVLRAGDPYITLGICMGSGVAGQWALYLWKKKRGTLPPEPMETL